ncbi:MAG: dethiobiotin synthase [Candidatus Thiothrix moscowensis]|nr:dethiobiotin synthase [Candidatus Thiothrix moscowensis]
MQTLCQEWGAWLTQTGLLQAPGLFMTGTDTGVGKTWVGIRLIQVLRQHGLEIAPRKPAESGWAEDVTQTDTWQLAQAAGADPQQVCANRLQAALAPPRAARLAGKTLTLGGLAAACLAHVQAGQFLFVEGAGGFYSPLAEDGLNADLAEWLGLPVILVTEDRVGCLNHVLLTIEAAQRRNLTVAGIILNRQQASVPAGMDNLADLRERCSIPLLQL